MPAKKKQPKQTEFVEEDEEQQPKESILDKILSMPEDEINPWEEVELPSGGKFYDSELMQTGVVRVRAMNLAIEKALANQRLAKSGQALDIMLKKCVQLPDPEFDHLDLLIGDRYFLMFVIRGITFGNEYDFTLRCPNCDMEGMYKYDLNDLFNTIRKVDKNRDYEYPIKIKLPYLSELMKTDIYVKLRYPTGKDLDNIFQSKFGKKARPKRRLENTADGLHIQASDNDITTILKKCIVEVNGEIDPIKISKFINRLHAKDLAIINDAITEEQPGIDTTIMVECMHCGEQIGPVMLPITDNFFRTTSSGGTGK